MKHQATFGIKIGIATVITSALLACGGGGVDSAPTSSAFATGEKTAQATAFLASFDQARATVATSPESYYRLNDNCYRSGGSTKADLVEGISANFAKVMNGRQYEIGSTRTLLNVIADRTVTNPDGSQRRELDISFRVNYPDGSVTNDSRETIASGSSSGLCNSPTVSQEWRFLGNRNQESVNVNPVNNRTRVSSLATGAESSNTSFRAIDFRLVDPQARYTYAVVTGPGTQTVAGITYTFSLKLISPRLLRNAPELAGKSNNYTNWSDGDRFRACIVPDYGSSSGPAQLADCVGNGATGSSWGWGINLAMTGTPSFTTEDQNFAAIGFQAGAAYTFALYNDDGWKTVNGQAGKTPVATRTVVLSTLPYTFAEMHGGATSKFPAWNGLTYTAGADLRSVINLSAPGSVNASWSNPAASFSDGRIFRLSEVGEFFQGSNVGNATGATWPRHRYYNWSAPGSQATQATVALTPTPSTISSKRSTELTLFFTDRNNRQIVLNEIVQ